MDKTSAPVFVKMLATLVNNNKNGSMDDSWDIQSEIAKNIAADASFLTKDETQLFIGSVGTFTFNLYFFSLIFIILL